jgi:hypothetical protein
MRPPESPDHASAETGPAVSTRSAPPRPAATGGSTRPAERRHSTAAVTTLVLLPVLVYAVPALLGHNVVPGDDLTQNLPLRELVGQDLRAGHLPLFDPYIWSGAPLLAGWNAGAAYPLTWLFAFVPATAAWTVNLIAAGAVAGTGCFAFLRASRLGVTASWLGGLTYAFGGGMVAQLPHIGLVVGMSWIPFGLLAILRLSERARSGARTRVGWTLALAVVVGLIALSGEPRADSNAAVVFVLYGGWRVGRVAWESMRVGRDRGDGTATGYAQAGSFVWSALCVAAGSVLGVGLGAVQLLPGLDAVSTSQRAQVTAYLFSAGSLPVRWLLLLGTPDLLGGSGSFGQPRFFAHYSLTEVTSYVGVLPLVACGALLFRRHRAGRSGAPGDSRGWGVWYVVAAVGAVLALGSHTALWHLFIHVPLFGGLRLQSRSILTTDLALAILFAYWADGWIATRRRGARDRREAVGGSAVALVIATVDVAALASPVGLLEWMGVSRATAMARSSSLVPWLVPSLALSLLAVVVLWSGAAMPRRWRATCVAVFTLVDLVVFVTLTVVAVAAPAPGAVPASAVSVRGGAHAGSSTRGPASSRARPLGDLGLRGRFAVYDPTLLDPVQLAALGATDENVVAGTYSVQGYGSIVDGRYAGATGTHAVSGTGQDVFLPRAAGNGTLDQLDTTDVVVPSPYLVTRKGASGPPAGRRTGTRVVHPGSGIAWSLGTPLDVALARVPAFPPAGRSVPFVRLGLVTDSGITQWVDARPVRRGSEVSLRLDPAHPVEAVAIVARTDATIRLGPPTLTTPTGTRYVVDGRLEAALTPPHWRYAGRDGPFAVFRNRRAHPVLSVRPLPGRSLAGATVRRLSGSHLAPSSAAVSAPAGAEVIRAVDAIPGWTATWRPVHRGPTVGLVVGRTGLVQVVDVPPGRGTLTWTYAPPGFVAGATASLASLGVLAGLAMAYLYVASGGRRRRSAAPRPWRFVQWGNAQRR